MLVSPAERPPFDGLGKVSSVPEQYGADFLMFSPVFGTVGVQRKEISDLVASLADGRVPREIIDLKGLDVGIWLIEGRLSWTSDGQLMGSRSKFSKAQWQGIVFSLLSQGFWILQSDSITGTIDLLSSLETWMSKTSHHSLNNRPGPRGTFGTADTKEWQIHFLQGLPGVGYERARLIVEKNSGIPFTIKPGSLVGIPGLGPKTIARIEEVFQCP